MGVDDGMGDASDGEILDIKLVDLQTSAPQFLTHSSDLATALAKLQETARPRPVRHGAATTRASSSRTSTCRTSPA